MPQSARRTTSPSAIRAGQGFTFVPRRLFVPIPSDPGDSSHRKHCARLTTARQPNWPCRLTFVSTRELVRNCHKCSRDELRERLFHLGVDAAQQAAAAVLAAGDQALGAHFTGLVAHGFCGIHQLEPAAAGMERRAGNLPRPGGTEPDTYLPRLTSALQNLGNVRRDLNHLEAARDTLSRGVGGAK